MPTPMPLASNVLNIHVIAHFACLDLRNVKVPLTIPSALPDADANANGIT